MSNTSKFIQDIYSIAWCTVFHKTDVKISCDVVEPSWPKGENDTASCQFSLFDGEMEYPVWYN